MAATCPYGASCTSSMATDEATRPGAAAANQCCAFSCVGDVEPRMKLLAAIEGKTAPVSCAPKAVATLFTRSAARAWSSAEADEATPSTAPTPAPARTRKSRKDRPRYAHGCARSSAQPRQAAQPRRRRRAASGGAGGGTRGGATFCATSQDTSSPGGGASRGDEESGAPDEAAAGTARAGSEALDMEGREESNVRKANFLEGPPSVSQIESPAPR